MKKMILALGLTVSILFGGNITALAETERVPTATFDGSKEISYNYDDTNHFGDGFRDMLPGETRKQEIKLQNTSDRAVDFFMSAAVIQAFEDMKEASGGAYHIQLSVEQDGQEHILYGNDGETLPNVGGEEKEGLKDWNGEVNDWFLAASLPAKGFALVNLKVTLDGESHNNAYQSAAGTFQFQFRAGYEEDQIIQVKKKGPDKFITQLRSVRTGDHAPVGIVTALLVGSAAVIWIIMYKKRRRQDEVV